MASTVNNGSSLTSVTLPGFDHNDTTLGNYYNSHLSTLPASQYYSVSSTGGNTWQTSVYSYQHTNNSVASATLIDFPTTHHQRLWPETALNRTTLLDSVSDSTAAASTHISASTLTSPYTTGGGVNSTSPFSLPYSPYFSSSPSNNLPHDDVPESNEEDLFLQYFRNRALDTPSLVALGAVYAVLIFIGAFGNGLVCLAVARQPKMRTSRNLFIINLAISDLLLCFFTIPFSLVEIFTKFWPFGVAMCKLVLALEGTSIFVSTLSITAIALDRHQSILQLMHPEQARPARVPHIVKLILIWIVGMMLALPLFLFRTVDSHEIDLAEIKTIKFCIEKWPIKHGRVYYSIFSMLIQYLVPITIVSVVYTRLCIKLRTRTLRRTATTQLSKVRSRLQRRARKTNLLLISIALIFCISWLPLNVLNIVADLCFPFKTDRSFRITFAICHMAGMSSSCSNPFIYGWLNQNFRNEFKEIFNLFKRYFFRFCLHKETTAVTIVREPENSLTLSPNNNKVIHYEPKNSQCTITDYTNAVERRLNSTMAGSTAGVEGQHGKNGQNVMMIAIEEQESSSQSASPEGKVVRHSVYFNPTATDECSREEEQQPQQPPSSDAKHSSFNCYRANSSCRFKRLSLTDSRKRKKRNQIGSNVAQNFFKEANCSVESDGVKVTNHTSSAPASTATVYTDRNGSGCRSKRHWLTKSESEESCHDAFRTLIPLRKN